MHMQNWEDTKARLNAWWKHSKVDRPVMKILAKRKGPIGELDVNCEPDTPEEFHLDVKKAVNRYRNFMKTHMLLADTFPNLDLNIGPGSMATYLGADPVFAWDTVWYKECVHDWKEFGELRFDPDNYWYKKHLEMIKEAKALSNGEFLINIPDIIENIDILSAMRGPQNMCYDLIDEPEIIKSYIEQVDNIYFKYYDAMYELVKGEDGSSSFTAFGIWGPGKTAKVQCDFAALMSPDQFREFIQPSLRKQCRQLDNSMYHLDGPDAIRHIDALLEIEELDAIQWSPGAGNPDGASEKWYPLFDKVKAAGKSIWIYIEDGGFKDWVSSADRFVKRYGSDGLYMIFSSVMEEDKATELINWAEKNWR